MQHAVMETVENFFKRSKGSDRNSSDSATKYLASQLLFSFLLGFFLRLFTLLGSYIILLHSIYNLPHQTIDENALKKERRYVNLSDNQSLRDAVTIFLCLISNPRIN